MREPIFLLFLVFLHQSVGLENYYKIDYEGFHVKMARDRSPLNAYVKMEIPVSRKFQKITSLLNKNSQLKFLTEADVIEFELESFGTKVCPYEDDFGIQIKTKIIYKDKEPFVPQPWLFKLNRGHILTNVCDVTESGTFMVMGEDYRIKLTESDLQSELKFCPLNNESRIFSTDIEAKFGWIQLQFKNWFPTINFYNDDWQMATRRKFNLRVGDIEYEFLFLVSNFYNYDKDKYENLRKRTFTKRKIIDENGLYAQLMSLTMNESSRNITSITGSLEGTKWWKDDTKVSMVIVYDDNKWDFHGNLTANLPDTYEQVEVLNFALRKYQFEATSNFWNSNFKLKIRKEKRAEHISNDDDDDEKSYYDVSYDGGSNEDCKIESPVSLISYSIDPEPSSWNNCWDSSEIALEMNGSEQIIIKQDFMKYDRPSYFPTTNFVHKTKISFDDISVIHQKLCGFSSHLCFNNLDFSLVHYDSGKSTMINPKLLKDGEQIINLSFGETFVPFFHFNSSVPWSPFSINFDLMTNFTHLSIAEIGKNKIWASLISRSDFELFHERDGNVSKLLKFKLLESDGKSLTGVMFDSSGEELSDGYTKFSFDTKVNKKVLELFLEMRSAQSHLDTRLSIGSEFIWKLKVRNGENGALKMSDEDFVKWVKTC